MSGQLCLKWNNHSIAFSKLLNKIFLEDVYADGTILCQGKFYPVHRFVLSTCSEYFEEMFRQCVRLNNKHPFIIVKDIHPEQMEALLNYMYKGEVNVPQEMLPDLIKAAEAFKIRGLAVPDEEPTPTKQSRKRSNFSSPPSISKKSRRQEDRSINNSVKNEPCESHKSDNSDTNVNNQISLNEPSTSTSENEIFMTESNFPEIKSEPIDSEEQMSVIKNTEEISLEKHEHDLSFQSVNTNYDDFQYNTSNDNYDEGQEPTSWDNSQPLEGEYNTEEDPAERMLLHPSMFKDHGREGRKEAILQACPFPGCTYTTTYAGHIKRHYRKHTGEKPFECPQCPYRASQKNNLDCHLSSVHLSEKPYHCAHCSYKSGHKGALKTHVLSRHRDLITTVSLDQGKLQKWATREASS